MITNSDDSRGPEGIGNMDGEDLKHGEKKAEKPLRTYPRVDERHAAYKILVENGIDKRQAALILGYKPKSAYEIEKRLEKKGKRIEVTTDRMVRKAVKGLKNCIDGKPWGDIKEIKDSTALAAINTVLDSSHPKQPENSPSNFTYVSVDLSAHLEKDSAPEAPPIYRIPPPASGISAPQTGQPTYPALREPAGGDPITPDEKSDRDEEPI